MPIEGRVLITGITGSLGTAILERAEKEGWNATFTGIARNEAKINAAKIRFPIVDFKVGDINDTDFLRAVFPDHDLILHCAAQKVIVLAENNVRNSVMVNVMGTLSVCQAAIEAGVGRVITIITDKAVQATTVYGSAKFLAGAISREANTWGKTRFSNVLYGNVIGSNESLLPYLIKRKAAGLPFQITDSRCTRFWLRMDDAIDIILRAYSLDLPGTTVIPKAPASKVLSLFQAVDPDWPIEDIGIRPGEKIHELMLSDVESRYSMNHKDYFLMYSPLIKMTSNLPDGFIYSSDNPDHILSVEELRSMLDLPH